MYVAIVETRLTDRYRNGIYHAAVVARTILDARKAYHGMDAAVSDLSDTGERSVDEVASTTVRFPTVGSPALC
jgi:hypothetical protein